MATRTELTDAKRVVVKVGSSSLTTRDGGIDIQRINNLVQAVADRRNSGTQIVLVSSGAIAAGLAPLGLSSRPADVATQQAAASVGQSLLVSQYAQAFSKFNITVTETRAGRLSCREDGNIKLHGKPTDFFGDCLNE